MLAAAFFPFFLISFCPPALCSTRRRPSKSWRDALRPDTFRRPRPRRTGQKRRLLAAAPEPRAARSSRASMARSHLLTRPSTVALTIFARILAHLLARSESSWQDRHKEG